MDTNCKESVGVLMKALRKANVIGIKCTLETASVGGNVGLKSFIG